jgi:tetratricopeptide (TPR) repeat protein
MGSQKGHHPQFGGAGGMSSNPQFASHVPPPNELDRGMNAAMMGQRPAGLFNGPMSAGNAGPMQQPGQQQLPSFVHEFEQQFGGNNNNGMMGLPPPQLAARSHGGDWIQDFSRMNMGNNNPMMERAYRQNFGGGLSGGRGAWAQEMARPPPPPHELDVLWREQMGFNGNEWASDMAARPASTTTDSSSTQQQQQTPEDAEAAMRATAEMVRALSQNPNLRNSNFYEFMSKLATGELKLEKNQVIPGDTKTTATTTSTSEGGDEYVDPLQGAWTQATRQHGESVEEMMKRAYGGGGVDEQQLSPEELMARAAYEGMSSTDGAMLDQWFKELNEGYGQYDSEEQFLSNGGGAMWDNQQRFWEMMGNKVQIEHEDVSPLEQPYELTQNNPYAQNKQAYEDGLVFFKQGRLQDALMAFHAAVEANPSHADAWHMLGVVHQENDEDKKAILCLERAVEQDAYHLDALLALGVSYVNELDHDRALKNLKAWVINNPAFQGLELSQDAYSDGSLMDDVMQLMLKAEKWAPKDSGVQEVLGVLYNVSKDYEAAVKAFRKAQSARPNDHTLWNKLGATYANGFRSEDAIPQYLRALELRPGYARCLLNLGISYSNMGNYTDAAKAYVQALIHSPDATHVWNYLRICFTSMDRFDLVPLTERCDLNALRQILNV